MRAPKSAMIEWVAPGSPAAQAGLLATGDRILRVNGKTPRDYIEYRYLIAEENVSLTFEDSQHRLRRIRLEKSLDEDLGISFTSDVFDGIITCGNRCAFCFVAQLPRGLRPSLYVRDDDYRLSFLHGNFITLTNLTPADKARIARLHLSPLYISVHATEAAVREKLFGRPTPEVLAIMRGLIAKGIEFHAQIVVCPGLNDGPHLERTVRDLGALFPGVRSIGVVPVGLTRHRGQQPRVRRVTPKIARELVATVAQWQREFLKAYRSRLVFAADELYLTSGAPLPSRAEYEAFAQLGNGIGSARLFLEGVGRSRPPKLRCKLSVLLVTGALAAPLVEALAAKLRQGGVEAKTCVVQNRLLGRQVTTAGLLAGRDIARAVRATGIKVDLIIVPGTAVREPEGFMDSMTLQELSECIAMPVAAAADPAEVGALLRRFAGVLR